MLQLLSRRIVFILVVCLCIALFIHMGLRMVRNSEISEPNYDLEEQTKLAWQDTRGYLRGVLRGDLGSIRVGPQTNQDQRPADFASRSRELWVPETIPVLRVYPPLSEDLLAGSGTTSEELLRAEKPLALKTSVDMSVETSESMRVEARNVLGVLPGRDPEYAGEVVVVGAHYDH